MLIESLIKRAEGTFVRLENEVYHFFTHVEGDPRHVCHVTDEDHIQTFLAVKEGYRIVKIAKPKADKPDDAAAKAAADKAAAEAAAKKAADEKAAADKAAADKAAADKAAADKAK